MTKKKPVEKKPGMDAGEALARLLQSADNALATSVGAAMGERAATAETAARLLFADLIKLHAPHEEAALRERYEKTFPFLKAKEPVVGFNNPPALDFERWLKKNQAGEK